MYIQNTQNTPNTYKYSHTHTHTHTLSHSLTHTLSHSLSHTHTLTLTHHHLSPGECCCLPSVAGGLASNKLVRLFCGVPPCPPSDSEGASRHRVGTSPLWHGVQEVQMTLGILQVQLLLMQTVLLSLSLSLSLFHLFISLFLSFLSLSMSVQIYSV